MKITQTRRLEKLIERYKDGGIDRRTFLGLTAAAAAALGVSARWTRPALAAANRSPLRRLGRRRPGSDR